MKAFLFNSDIERLMKIKANLTDCEAVCSLNDLFLNIKVTADPERPTEAANIEISVYSRGSDYDNRFSIPIWTPPQIIGKLAETLVKEFIERKAKKG